MNLQKNHGLSNNKFVFIFPTEYQLKCSECNEEFQSLVKYGYHKAEMHSIMRPYDCVLCSVSFCTRHELFMHLHNHIGIIASVLSFESN